MGLKCIDEPGQTQEKWGVARHTSVDEVHRRSSHSDPVCVTSHKVHDLSNIRTSLGFIRLSFSLGACLWISLFVTVWGLGLFRFVLVHNPGIILAFQRLVVNCGHELRAHSRGSPPTEPKMLNICLSL